MRDAGFDVTVSPFYSREYFGFVYRPGNYVRKAAGFVALTLAALARAVVDPRLRSGAAVSRSDSDRAAVDRTAGSRSSAFPIVYDFDDAIFLPAVSEANQAVSFLKNPGARLGDSETQSSRSSVGNEFLAGYARRFNPHVTVIPTAVDTNRFVPRAECRARPNGGKLVVGWIGSPTTFRYLESLKDVLATVAARHPFTLKVSGAGRPVDFPGVDVQVVPWSMADEVSLFNTCDIGVYPLTDDDWSRGKCGFKAIQCMACGVPVVAAAVGVNREIITHGVNSMLASTPQEWIEHLERLLTECRTAADAWPSPDDRRSKRGIRCASPRRSLPPCFAPQRNSQS